MRETFLSNPRHRAGLLGVFVVVASLAAGYGVYTGTMKILAVLGLITLGIFFRQANFSGGYFVTLTCLALSHTLIAAIRDEFDIDKWIAIIALSIVSMAIVAFQVLDPPWPRAIHALVLALGAFSIWSASWSTMPSISFAKAGIFSLGLIIAFVGAWAHGRTIERVLEILAVHVHTLWIVFPLGVVLYVGGRAGSDAGGRYRSVFENPNNLGFWVSLSVPLLVGLGWIHPSRWMRRICWLMVACGALIALLSGSRGGVIGAFLGVVLLFFLRAPKRTVALGVMATLVIVFLTAYGLAVLPESNTLDLLIREESLDDLSDRRTWWEIGYLIASQRPWLGHGFGLGDLLFAPYGLDLSSSAAGPTVHNTYLDAYMNLGRIGLALLVAIQTWTAWVGFRSWRRDREGMTGRLSLVLVATIVSVSAHAMVESVLLSVGNPWGLPFWVTVALIHRLAVIGESEASGRATAMPVT